MVRVESLTPRRSTVWLLTGTPARKQPVRGRRRLGGDLARMVELGVEPDRAVLLKDRDESGVTPSA